MNNKQVGEKGVFVVALLGSFLALSAFKDELKAIRLIFGSGTVSLLGILIVFGLMLMLSAYLYALDYVRYSFGKYQNFFIFRTIIPIANFFYSLALIFPIFIFILWIADSPPFHQFNNTYRKPVLYFDIIAGLILIIGGLINSYILSKRKKKEDEQIIEKSKENSLRRAIELLGKDFFGESLVESFKTLEFALRERLFEKQGFDSKFLNMTRLLELSNKNQVIDPKLVPRIKEIQQIRNKFAHEYTQVTQEQAKSAIEVVRKIIEYTKN